MAKKEDPLICKVDDYGVHKLSEWMQYPEHKERVCMNRDCFFLEKVKAPQPIDFEKCGGPDRNRLHDWAPEGPNGTQRCHLCGALRSPVEPAADKILTLHDPVNHPSHYTQYKGLEIIDLTEQMNFNLGNAVKYIARAGHKDPDKTVEDLQKAVWYAEREIKRLTS